MVSINPRDGRPIYDQVREGFKRLIMTGALQPDEKLPSVRELAASLSINPNTIQKAYRELERDGWCYSIPGKGSFAASRETPNRARIDTLLVQVRKAVAELRYLGCSEEEIAACLQRESEHT